MAANGITGAAADQIVQSISSFALYGFPESHAASFALIVYASAYLKAHYPAAFYTALLNNQPMGFYHPATLVKDAQRRGVRFAPVDVQVSDWNCVVQEDGAIRMGLRCVKGLREEAGRRIEGQASGGRVPDAQSLMPTRFSSLDDLVARTHLRQDEVRTLAEIGALASFGGDRRTALWQAERAGRPAGPLLHEIEDRVGAGPWALGSGEEDFARPSEGLASASPGTGRAEARPSFTREPSTQSPAPTRAAREPRDESREPTRLSPLPQMSLLERVKADYDGTGLTIGPHPMSIVRASLAPRGILRASELKTQRVGRRVRVAGAVITRQRPGTAKGFVFLSLEDETGISNIIVNPDVFAACKRTIVDEPYLVVEGVLQNQDGAVSVKADRVLALRYGGPEAESHDFH
jgi:error-prone DNA polymerase